MAVGVIPARIASTRLADKALVDVGGRALVRHVVANARRAASIERVIVATDDERIAEAARAEDAEAVMTDPALPSGTDRVAAACRALGVDDEIIVNIQGDEPELDPATIDAVVAILSTRPDFRMATAACPLLDRAEFESPDRVKVVIDHAGRALYFSRAPIPYERDRDGGEASPSGGQMSLGLGHIGLYAFRRDALFDFVAREPSSLERVERLEQLRALQHEIAIGVALVEHAPHGIDTAEDLEKFRRRYEQRT